MSEMTISISSLRNEINRLGSEIYVTTIAMTLSKNEKYTTLAHDLAQDNVARANELLKLLDLQQFNTNVIADDIAFLNQMIKLYYDMNL